MSITILGAGAFGAALAVALARDGRTITLWARDPAQVEVMRRDRVAPRLPGIALPDSVVITQELDRACNNDVILLTVPMQALAGVLERIEPRLGGCALVACCKGIDLETLKGPTVLIREIKPMAVPAVLTGPSFAKDIAQDLPTALTLACADLHTGTQLQNVLSTRSIRLYRSEDVVGAELGGALKNVIAIACGVCIGAGLGESARAALMTRGFAEMTRLAARLGAQADTLTGLSGFGDLVLTCASEGSRNFSYGLALGRGQGFDPSITVEGAKTAAAVARLAQELQMDMPICHMVNAVIDRNVEIKGALRYLLDRPLKEE